MIWQGRRNVTNRVEWGFVKNEVHLQLYFLGQSGMIIPVLEEEEERQKESF